MAAQAYTKQQQLMHLALGSGGGLMMNPSQPRGSDTRTAAVQDAFERRHMQGTVAPQLTAAGQALLPHGAWLLQGRQGLVPFAGGAHAGALSASQTSALDHSLFGPFAMPRSIQASMSLAAAVKNGGAASQAGREDAGAESHAAAAARSHAGLVQGSGDHEAHDDGAEGKAIRDRDSESSGGASDDSNQDEEEEEDDSSDDADYGRSSRKRKEVTHAQASVSGTRTLRGAPVVGQKRKGHAESASTEAKAGGGRSSAGGAADPSSVGSQAPPGTAGGDNPYMNVVLTPQNQYMWDLNAYRAALGQNISHIDSLVGQGTAGCSRQLQQPMQQALQVPQHTLRALGMPNLTNLLPLQSVHALASQQLNHIAAQQLQLRQVTAQQHLQQQVAVQQQLQQQVAAQQHLQQQVAAQQHLQQQVAMQQQLRLQHLSAAAQQKSQADAAGTFMPAHLAQAVSFSFGPHQMSHLESASSQ